MAVFRRAAALLLAVMLFQTAVLADEPDIILPEPPSAVRDMILGDSSSAQSHEVTLYFAADNGTGITSSTRSIPAKMNQSLIEGTLNALLNSRFSENSTNASADVQLIDVELSCGIATVNLSIGSSAQLSDQAELQRCTAIANTLLKIEGIHAVNILTGGRSDAICSLPMGAYSSVNEAFSARYAQLQSERKDFLTQHTSKIHRDVVLYFPTSNGYLLPELRSIEFSSNDYASAILSAIQDGPMQSMQSFCPIPGENDILYSPPRVEVNAAGERVLYLDFSGMLPNYLAFSGVQLWQFYGSIVLSMCSFMPELDGVTMCIEGAQIADYALGERIVSFPDNLMRRSDFTAMIGSSAALYYTDADGSLVRVETPLPQASAASPKGILGAMVTNPVPAGLYGVFPSEIFADDILGVRLDAGVAAVNLSGSFYARCQNLNAAQERNLIYAMVNTLCELPGIGAVRFLVEGMTVDSLCQSIYLKTHLLPDPGLSD